MGVVKFGFGITEVRGKVGGAVFSKNSTSHYVRNLTVPVNPNTARQVAVRAAVALLTARWSDTLTKLQRDAWDLYASLVTMENKVGEDIFLSGFNHYIRSNTISVSRGSAAIDAGPTIFELPAQDPTFAVAATEAAQTVTFTADITLPWAIETGGLMYVYQGKPQNAQRNFFGGPWRWIGTIVGIDPGGPVPPLVFPVAFAITEGQRQWTYGRIRRADGRLSEPMRADTFCAA